jgi:GT2 family glycosyltransferase
MKVAAVIPQWNRAALLRTLLENLKSQTRLFDEVVVVDNGSTDGSADLAAQAGARVIRLDRNYGFATAVNRGIAATAADWVAILNNDVTVEPAWLERLLGASMNAADVRASALDRLEKHREEFLADYTRRFGNVLNADSAAELFPEYAASLESRARFRVAVHPAAQWIRDELFRRALANPTVRDVVFTAGGNGAGKTSSAPVGDIVYDSTLNNIEHATRILQQCLDAEKLVQIAYVFRPIAEAFLGVLSRAKTEGRTVAVDTVVKTHTEAAKTAAALFDVHGNDPRIIFHFLDNSGPSPQIRGIALTAREDYASSRDELYRILERERVGLAKQLYEASAGSRVRSQSGRKRAPDDRESQQTLQSQERAGRPEVVYFATGKILSAHDHARLDGAWDAISRAACPVRIGAGAPDGPTWNSARPIHMTSMTACLVRREVFTELGLLDERFESYLEDVDFGVRCAKAGFGGVYEPSAIAYHQGSSTWGRWNPDTVRLLSRNQVLLAGKHFSGQPRCPILAGQLLWGLVALRHGCGWAWLKGKLDGFALHIENETLDQQSFGALLRESEAEILAHHHELYWRLYSWLAPR